MTPPLEPVLLNPETARVALAWPERARALVIRTPNDCVRASEELKGIKALRKELDEFFGPHIDRAYQAHRALCADKKKHETPLLEAEGILKRSLADWDDSQERLRRAEQDRLQREAREREEQRRLNEAAELEQQAFAQQDIALMAEAEELITAPLQTPAVIVGKTTPKVAGISYRQAWKFDIVDVSKIPVNYLAAGLLEAAKLNRVDPRLTAIRKVVEALGSNHNIPGIRAYTEKQVAAGSR